MEEIETVIAKWRRVAESSVVGLMMAIGIGTIATVFAAMMHDPRLLLIIVWICASIAIWEGSRIFQVENLRGATFLGALLSGGGIFLLYVALAPRDFQNNESLPGFAGYELIKIEETPEARRKIYFSATDPEGAIVVFYQSKSDMFRLVVGDIDGEFEALNIPSGHNGIPLNQWIVLTYDVGVAADHSFMRVSMNGHSVAERNFPFRLAMGSRNWTISMAGGKDWGKFEMMEVDRFAMTLTKEDTNKIVANRRKLLGF